MAFSKFLIKNLYNIYERDYKSSGRDGGDSLGELSLSVFISQS